jgi:hypothetical protein
VSLKVGLPAGGPACDAAATKLTEFMTSKLGFAFETTGISCQGAGNGTSGRRMSRRLAQSDATYDMVANLAGPDADVSLGTAIKPDSPDNVLKDFDKAFPGSSSISSDVGEPSIQLSDCAAPEAQPAASSCVPVKLTCHAPWLAAHTPGDPNKARIGNELLGMAQRSVTACTIRNRAARTSAPRWDYWSGSAGR